MSLSTSLRRVRAENASALHRRAQSPAFHFPVKDAALCADPNCDAVFRLAEKNVSGLWRGEPLEYCQVSERMSTDLGMASPLRGMR